MGYKRFTASQKQFRPDPRHNSKLAAKFINCFMVDGKKAVMQRVFYDALDIIGGHRPEKVPTSCRIVNTGLSRDKAGLGQAGPGRRGRELRHASFV